MKRRFTLLAIAAIMSTTLMAQPSQVNGKYQIATKADLEWIAANPSHWGDSYEQADDIDLNNKSWTPIGTSSQPFTGTYDGNGFIIENLYYNNPANVEVDDTPAGSNVGLFGYISGATLTKITVASGLVSGAGAVSGICGFAVNSSISYCTNNATVYGKMEQNGGICGYLEKSTITDCINFGLISGSNFTGGVVGRCKDNNLNCIINCVNVGQVFSFSTTSGNIIGFNDNKGATITNCYYDNQINVLGGLTSSKDQLIPNEDENGHFSGKATSDMIGTKLQETLTDGNWCFEDGLYPRLKFKEDQTEDAIILAATPVVLAIGDKADSITANFAVSKIDGVVWTSGNTDNLTINNDDGSTEIKRSTAIVLTATKSGYTKKVYLKTNNGTNKIDSLTVDTEQDLKDLRDAVNNYGIYKGCANYDGFKGINFKQSKKITLSDWTEPIGTHNSFKGNYNGQGNTIEGVNVDLKDAGISNVGGLFGCASFGKIENVTINGKVSGIQSVGGICGLTFKEIISNCSSNCTVTNTNQVGGIVGVDKGFSTLTDCQNTGKVTGERYVGGFIGRSNSKTNFIRCKNLGEVESKSSDAGGICGNIANNNNKFDYCENHNTITAKTNMVGGIVGSQGKFNCVFTNCINSGEIIGKSGSNIGGIIGQNSGTTATKINNCLNTGTTSNGSGICDSQNATISNCFNAGDTKNAIAPTSASISKCINIGNATETLSSGCYYDKKLYPTMRGGTGKKTSEMTGDALDLEEEWIYTTNMYPMPKGLENSDYMKLYATALILDDNDELSEVKNNFTVGTANDVEWSCNTSNVAFVNGEGIISNPGVDAEDANVIVTVSLGSITKSINLTIKATGKAEPSIKWVDDTDDDGIVDDINITYGQEITDAMLAFTFKNAEDEDKGTTVKNVNVGTKMDAGTHTISVTFTPKSEYASVMGTKTITRKINVAKADAQNYIWWTPQNITYGENYESKIKNAKMIVDGNEIQGTFTYNIPTLDAGNNKEVSVSFESKNYYTSELVKRYINVAKAKASIQWTLAPIEYGTPISYIQLGAFSSFGPVTYQYKENVNGSKDVLTGVILPVGNYVICATIELGDDAGNYEGATIERTLVVNKATPTITWNKTYVETTYGNTLSADQLFASVPAKYQDKGTISYFVDGQSFDITANHSAGTYAISAKFTPNDNVNYSSVTTSTTATLTVKPITPTITWNNTTVTINYGETVSEDRLKASVEDIYRDKGTISYYVDEQPFDIRAQLGAGTYNVIAKFSPNDTHNYTAVTTPTPATITVHKSASAPTITWNPVTPIVFGTALSNAQLNASSEAPGTITYTENGNDVTIGTVLSVGDHTITATLPASANYEVATEQVTITVNKATPIIGFEQTGKIIYGATTVTDIENSIKDSATFNNVKLEGNFTYDIPENMNPGTRTISITFNPNESGNFNSATTSAKITVSKATPVVTWEDIDEITYGTPLWTTQLNATIVNGDGSINYTLADGINATNAVLDAGTHEITATLEVSQYFEEWKMTKTIKVNQAVPAITWEPNAVAWGASAEEIDSNVKNAVAKDAKGNVLEGEFAYTIPELTAAGEVEVSVTFENKNYKSTSATTKTINVTKAYPVIAWTPQNITFGASSDEIVSKIDNAQASYNGEEVKGAFEYDTNIPNLNAGTHVVTVKFTPQDGEKFNDVEETAELTIEKATPTIVWEPKNVTYGASSEEIAAALENAEAQFNGETVSGDYEYILPLTTDLQVGLEEMDLIAVVTFTPTGDDTTNFEAVSTIVNVVVEKATPVITWNTPEDITVGTALSAAQLNATANVEGNFAYTPAADAVLEVGEHQKLSVVFTPTDAENYNSASDSVFINVKSAASADTTQIDSTAAIVWAPSAIVYGTPIGETFNATAKVEGEITYSLAADSILNAGEYKVTAKLSPVNGNDTTIERIVKVAKAELTATAANDTIMQGDTIPTFEINYTGFVGNDNVASLTTAPTATCSASTDSVGSFDIVVSGGEAINYNFVHVNGLLVVLAKNDTALIPIDTLPNHNDTLPHNDTLANDTVVLPVIYWSTPKSMTYGEVVDSTNILYATANIEGRFEYAVLFHTILDTINNSAPSPVGVEENNKRILSVGDTLTPGDYTLTATFYPADTTLSSVVDTAYLWVKRAILTVSVADVTINQGDAMPEFTILYKGFVFGENESILTNAPKAKCDANTNVAGIYEIVFWGSTGFSDNYELDFIDGKLTVLKKADDPSAINETAAIFEVYPNPSNGAFFVNAGDDAKEVRIFNSTGKLVKVENIEGVTRIDISEYANGMYFVKVGNQTKTIIKQ